MNKLIKTTKEIEELDVSFELINIKINTMKITHKSKEKFWKDETNTSIPYNRVTKSERLMERYSATILRKAKSINKELRIFKEDIRKLSQEAYDAFMLEKNVSKKTKGNFTWHNFNRTIKIEVSINEPISFDELTIKAAKTKFDEFFGNNISASNDFIKEMAMDAFQTSKGKLDVSKILNITRYKSKINKPLFTEAVDLIEQAIRRPKTKTYFRVWVKDEAGEYQNIELNLSSI